MARKPLEKGLTVAQNVLKWGTGAINIDGCRIETSDETARQCNAAGYGLLHGDNPRGTEGAVHGGNGFGRFPANCIHDGSDEVEAGFPNVNGPWGGNGSRSQNGATSMFGIGNNPDNERYKGSGSASRFFYTAKASKYDRNAGLDGVKFDGLELIVCYTCNRKLQVCQEKNITSLEGSVRRQKDTGVCRLKVICECGIEAKSDTALNTFLSGSESMVKFQKAIKSIIETKTNSITTSRTLNLKPHLNIKENTAVANLLTASGISLVENAELANTLTAFINDLTGLLPDASDVLSLVQLKINVKENRSDHPTVKPTDLMQYLCRLVTPPGGLILDPFLGSGSTAKAALIERFRIVGIEIDSEYAKIADARCKELQVELF